MLRMIVYIAMVIFTGRFHTTTEALPVAVSSSKDQKICCQCTVEEDDEKKESKVITDLSSAFTGLKTVNVLTSSLTGCDGILSSSSVSGTAGGLITTGLGGAGNILVPSVQIQVPQLPLASAVINLPAATNYLPTLQQPSSLFNVQPLQTSFFSIQQPKISTQCCVPCPDGIGMCCCIPGATTTTTTTLPPPTHRELYTLYPPFQSTATKILNKNTSVFASLLTLFFIMNIF